MCVCVCVCDCVCVSFSFFVQDGGLRALFTGRSLVGLHVSLTALLLKFGTAVLSHGSQLCLGRFSLLFSVLSYSNPFVGVA